MLAPFPARLGKILILTFGLALTAHAAETDQPWIRGI